MSLHVYTTAGRDSAPVRFYDTDAKIRYDMTAYDDGSLVISLFHIDKPRENIAIFSPGTWLAAFDVKYDPNL